MFNRFLKMNNDRMNKKVFLWDKALCKDNWSSHFRDTLADLDLNNSWENSICIPMESAKLKVTAKFERDWNHHCLTKPKLLDI